MGKFIVFFAFCLGSLTTTYAQQEQNSIHVRYSIDSINAESIFALFLPLELEIFIQGENTLYKPKNSVVSTSVIFNEKLKATYILNNSDKQAIIAKDNAEMLESSDVLMKNLKVVNTGRIDTVLGFACKVIEASGHADDMVFKQTMWIAEDIHFKIPEEVQDPSMFIPENGIQGFPLRMKNCNSLGGEKIEFVMEATFIEFVELDEAIFDIPAEYKIVNLASSK